MCSPVNLLHIFRIPFYKNTSGWAMYKTRNTEMGSGKWGTRGMGGMLYSAECRQIFRGMSSNIPGNVAKHSWECLKDSGECRQIFREMALNIPESVLRHSEECLRHSRVWERRLSPRFHRICSTESCMEFVAAAW